MHPIRERALMPIGSRIDYFNVNLILVKQLEMLVFSLINDPRILRSIGLRFTSHSHVRFFDSLIWGGRRKFFFFPGSPFIFLSGDDRLRQREYWCGFASVREGNGSRHPLLHHISATADVVPAVFKKAFANFTFAPAFAMAA